MGLIYSIGFLLASAFGVDDNLIMVPMPSCLSVPRLDNLQVLYFTFWSSFKSVLCGLDFMAGSLSYQLNLLVLVLVSAWLIQMSEFHKVMPISTFLFHIQWCLNLSIFTTRRFIEQPSCKLGNVIPGLVTIPCKVIYSRFTWCKRCSG